MIKYYKRVKNNKIVELHVHKEYDNYVTCKIYPQPSKEEYYNLIEFQEVDSLDEWLDTGINEKIFTIDVLEPQQSASTYTQ